MSVNHRFRSSRRVTVALAAILPFIASAASAGERTTTVLAENWYLKQLDSDKPDVAALTREVASPDKTWLPARMPAQVHDVLLADGKIPDPLREALYGCYDVRALEQLRA